MTSPYGSFPENQNDPFDTPRTDENSATNYGQEQGGAHSAPTYGQEQASTYPAPTYGQEQSGTYSAPTYGQEQAQNTYPASPVFGSEQPSSETGDVNAKGAKNFLNALFDFNFDNYLSVSYAKFIYVIAIIAAAIQILFFWIFPFFILLLSGEDGSGMLAFVTLLFGWIPVGISVLFQLIFVRLILEFITASVRTAENTTKLVRRGE